MACIFCDKPCVFRSTGNLCFATHFCCVFRLRPHTARVIFSHLPPTAFAKIVIFVNVMKYSVIIPVYNRPAEVGELLESIAGQPRPDVEIIIVEDGSQTTCEEVVARFQNRLNITYLKKGKRRSRRRTQLWCATSLGRMAHNT